jgi:enoyl-CoA hydratase/carnithine racemase
MTADPDDAVVSLTIDDAFAVVTLNRADRLNSQTPTVWQRLREIGGALPGTVRVVLVRGAGRSFSAGLDTALFQPDGLPGEPSLAALAALSPEAGSKQIGEYQGGFAWLSRPDLISIAAVQGHAIGAGFQLALACDLRILADDAQLAMAEVPLGLVPDLGGTRRLLEIVGYPRALEICLTGRRIPAPEALTLGLATRVVAAADLPDQAEVLARSLLELPRSACVEVKALLQQGALRSQADQEIAERAAQHRLLRERAGFADS